MKKHLTTLFTLLVLAAGIGGTQAKAADHEIKGNVPFSFYVGNQKFEPGVYYMQPNPAHTMLVLRDSTKRVLKLSLANPTRDNAASMIAFTFRKVEGSYFLDAITNGANSGCKLLPGKLHLELLAAKTSSETITLLASAE